MSLLSNFRDDINGLRAIAVVAVVFFHFQVPGFGAGFLGVDIFFVISGYLMAALLLKALSERQNTRKSLRVVWEFYVARARRVMPALYMLIAVLLLLGWWVLGPDDYVRLVSHARSAIAFVSNQQFYSEIGYFDVKSQEKWLLHTWSLSIEWQYYFLLPILIVGLWRVKADVWWLSVSLASCLLCSWIWGVKTTIDDPEAAFFLFSSRVWELLAGSVIYLTSCRLVVTQKFRRALEVIGLGLIVASLVYYDKQTSWPGIGATIPIIGTALVLLAADAKAGWAKSMLVRWLGNTSFSLYLWHWPVFVALVFLGLQDNTLALLLAILLSLVLGGLSYYFVEQPTRRAFMRLGSNWTPLILGLAASILSGATLAITNYQGLPERMSARFNEILAEENNSNPYLSGCHGKPSMAAFPWCQIGGESIKAVVVGDSHAASIVMAVKEALALGPEDGVIHASYTSCQTLLGVKKTRKRLQCAEFNDFILKQLDAVATGAPLIVANRLSAAIFGSHLSYSKRYGQPSIYFGSEAPGNATPEYLREIRAHLISSACVLSERRTVYWLLPTPEFPQDAPRWLARKYLLLGDDADISMPRFEYEARNEFVKDALNEAARKCSNLRLVDPASYLCNRERCFASKNGMPLYYDSHHLSERGNRLLVSLFSDSVKVQ